MTTANPNKILKQIAHKPAKVAKFTKHSTRKERSCGQTKKPCVRCGRFGSHLGQYKLDLCRQCFREIATKIGFKQYS